MFPYYLTYGMTYEQYWFGDPTLVIAYREAHKLSNEQKNQEMWVQGYYVFTAFQTALSNIHLDGKRHTMNQYMESPLELYKPKKTKEQEAEEAKQKVIATFNNIKRAWDEKRGKKQCQ